MPGAYLYSFLNEFYRKQSNSLDHAEDGSDTTAAEATVKDVDQINHPPHYKSGGVEVIDIIEAFRLPFRLANVIKYVLRADRKGNRLKDLKKAKFYLDREIERSEASQW